MVVVLPVVVSSQIRSSLSKHTLSCRDAGVSAPDLLRSEAASLPELPGTGPVAENLPTGLCSSSLMPGDDAGSEHSAKACPPSSSSSSSWSGWGPELVDATSASLLSTESL